MTATQAAFGLRPVKLLGDRPFNHGLRQIKIASGYASNIFNGDLVTLVAGGTIEKDTGTATATPVGIFMGCTYTDPNLNYLVHRQYWPTGTVASDAYAYVCDDPDALFLIQANATCGQEVIGTNMELVQGAVIDFWERDEIDTAFPWLLVKINEGDHQYRNSTANATA